jgi:hypothetical protein
VHRLTVRRRPWRAQELKANRGGMPPAVVKSFTWQLLQALSYLHRKQILHRVRAWQRRAAAQQHTVGAD